MHDDFGGLWWFEEDDTIECLRSMMEIAKGGINNCVIGESFA